MPVNSSATYAGATPVDASKTRDDGLFNALVDGAEAFPIGKAILKDGRSLAEFAELSSTRSNQMLSTTISGIDVVMTWRACANANECYTNERPHESLLKMTVVNQDVLVTVADFGIPPLVAAKYGPAAGMITDFATTMGSLVYDTLDALEFIPNVISVGSGKNSYGFSSYYILYYPQQREERPR